MSILLLVIYPTEIDKYVKNEYIQGYFLEKIGKHPKAHQQRPSLISFMPNFSISLIVPFPCLQCVGFSYSLEHSGYLIVASRLTCPTACEILLPLPEVEPAFPAVKGGFLTTGPPGKSL